MLPVIQNYLKTSRPIRAYTPLSIAILLLVVSLGLAACGSNTGSGNTPTPTPTPTTHTQLQKCGTIHTNPRGIPTDIPAAKHTEDCFWQAFQKCAPASLVYTLIGVDTVTTRTFTIQTNSGHCSVSDAFQHTIVPAPLSTAKTYMCTGAAQKPDGLHFSGCGQDGDIVVALQASSNP